MCEVWDAYLCRCMRYCISAFVWVREKSSKKAVLLRSNTPLCISDAPLSHDSHELSAAALAVSFGPAARSDPLTSNVLGSLSRAANPSSNHLKIQYTWSVWCCRDWHTVWAGVEKMEERKRERGRDAFRSGGCWLQMKRSSHSSITNWCSAPDAVYTAKAILFQTCLYCFSRIADYCVKRELLFQSGVVDLHLLPVVRSQRKHCCNCIIFSQFKHVK